MMRANSLGHRSIFFFANFISKLSLWPQAIILLLSHTTTPIPCQSSSGTEAAFKETGSFCEMPLLCGYPHSFLHIGMLFQHSTWVRTQI